MSPLVERNRARAHRQGVLCLALLSMFSPSLEVRSQNATRPDDLLPPPKFNLVPVHWPDLTKLEADVREQLMSLQSSLPKTVKTNSSEARLSNASGTMQESYHPYSSNHPPPHRYL